MKKALSIIIALCLVFALVGCSNANVTSQDSYISETVIITETNKAKADNQAAVAGTVPSTSSENLAVEQTPVDILTAEDKAVKAEIAKYSDTAVDFRSIKQEKISAKTYNLSFLELDHVSNYERVVYQNETGDIFKYSINTGKLTYALIESAIVEKTVSAIDIATAQKIAFSYVSSKCNINEYVMDLSAESNDGYKFSYRRYICDYKTADVFVINISFNGEISYIIDNTHVFEGIDISKILINKDWVDSNINKKLTGLNDDTAKLQENTITITVKDGKPQLMFSIAVGNSVGAFYIPIE